MHTPEPQRTRTSGGGGGGDGAEGVTPQVASASVTPTLRAGFLRRGDAAPPATLHDALAAGPSVLFDEEGGTSRSTDASPQPSQLMSQPSSQLQPGGQTRLPRQRPRFHTVQDLDVALNQAIEGKINSRNAWASKEASDLLEGITHTIETTLDAASADDYTGFAKAATVVEGCSKVWTSRVDSTYLQSNQMVQRLLRKDETAGRAPGEAGEDGAEEDGEDEAQRNKSRSRSAAATAATRTLALDATEINLDSKGRTALTQTGVNAQFRAITSKFDQGNAQGLLMNNAPLGRAGNLILDVDYSLLPTAVTAGRGSGRRNSSGRRGANPPQTAATAGAPAEGTMVAEGEADPRIIASRTSQHVAVEHDAAIYETVVDFPPYAGVTALTTTDADVTSSGASSPNRPSNARASFSFPHQHHGVSNNVTHLSQASQIDPLLVLSHTASCSPASLLPSATADLDDARRGSANKAEEHRLLDAGGVENVGEEHRKSSQGADEAAVDMNAGGYDDDDVAGDWAGGAEDYKDYSDDDTPYPDQGVGRSADASRSTGALSHDPGLEARNLVSGVTEMEAMDTLFHGHTQLALEAEDPTSWCPLSEVAKNPLADGFGRSELSRLHREHRFTQSQRQPGSRHGGANRNSGTDAVNAAESFLRQQPQSLTNPTAKRGRKERTVVFQLPHDNDKDDDVHGRTFSLAPGQAAVLSTKAELLADGALRQATTAARNMTPLGKKLLLGKDAPHAVAAFTQSAVQRSKAEQAGLVLSEAPVPGKTIPPYMPYPIHTQDYFQPFSTPLTQWNLLRKSATGRLIDSSANNGTDAIGSTLDAAANGVAGGIGSNNSTFTRRSSAGGHRLGDYGGDEIGSNHEEHDDDGVAAGGYRDADMPVEFFPGGAEVEGLDGVEAGGDYADYADLYGPDDNDGDHDNAEAERRYVQGGFRSSADARVLAQVDLAATTAVAVARSSSGSSAAFSRTSNGGDGALPLSDPMALLQVLSSPEATMPNQVDVVRLRQLMWEALLSHLAANQQDTAADLAALRNEEAGATATSAAAAAVSSGGDAARNGVPAATKTAVKAHAQAVLDRMRKRARAAEALKRKDGKDESEESNSEDTETENEDEEERESGRQQPQQARRKQEEAAAAATTAKDSSAEVAVTRFSDVVRSVLPHIASISSTNTLSPAFFFFSILFLANEHNVVLQNVDALDDLRVCGIARGVGESE